MQTDLDLPWDDLRLVHAIAEANGLAAAARRLGLNHSTVFRRLARIEALLHARLFDRDGGRYRPTEAGARLAAGAARMAEEAAAAARAVAGGDQALSGLLRVTSSETLAYRMLPAILGAFCAVHPAVQVELLVDNRILDLSRREADVALRAGRPEDGALFGRKLADIGFALYGAPAYLEAHGTPRDGDLAGHRVVFWDETGARGRVAQRYAPLIAPAAVAYRTNSLIGQMMAAKAGIGLAILPCYLADSEPGLHRLGAPFAQPAGELWIVTHRDLRRTARVRAFLDLVGDRIAVQQPAIAGRVG